MNEDNNQGNDNNNNNDNSSSSSNSGRSSRQSNNNNNQNQNDMHLVTVDGTGSLLDMYHVDDNISEAYYNTSTNRFNANLSDNFENYPIANTMRCREVIAPVAPMPYGHNLAVNNLWFESDSDDDSLGDEHPPLIKRQRVDSNMDLEYDSDCTAATKLSTTCSWDMLETDLDELKVTTNNEALIVSLPPSRFIRTPMGLLTSPYKALVAAKTDKADLTPTTMITVTKVNESHQGRFRFKALFDSGSTNIIISCHSLL